MAVIGNSSTQQAFTPAIDYFSGTGSATAFTLSRPVASVAQVQVTIDNVAQNPSSAFTVSSNTITFTSAPLSGTNNIYVYYTSPITQVIAPGQSTVGLTAFTATGTASASTYLRGDNSWATIAATTPGGSTTQLQYNNAGAFGGISGVTTDGTRMTASTTIGVGGATPSTSGSGITFPATQSASSNANTLDDYEEGTWTPSLGGNTTYAAQVGTYTKIGKIVYVSAYLIVTTIGTGSTTFIDGLPFSGTTTSSAGGIVAFSGLASSVTFLSLSAENGTTRLSNRYTTSNTTAAASNGALYTSGIDLQVWALFFTS